MIGKKALCLLGGIAIGLGGCGTAEPEQSSQSAPLNRSSSNPKHDAIAKDPRAIATH